ncbi:MAG: hypothetical protein K0U47_06975 [Epsilonproteobacteria bacterium]|nr:hypothetical protein [Campylobacterota bacterium]
MNAQTIQIIKATAPIIKSKGEEITSIMYPILFERYPKANALFKDAPENQREKLANAIYAYAANIDKLENLKKGIDTMALAHVKTNIKPEHYPWVKESLLEAIKQVLKEDATEEIIDAWDQAYDFLATVLIDREKELYTVL